MHVRLVRYIYLPGRLDIYMFLRQKILGRTENTLPRFTTNKTLNLVIILRIQLMYDPNDLHTSVFFWYFICIVHFFFFFDNTQNEFLRQIWHTNFYVFRSLVVFNVYLSLRKVLIKYAQRVVLATTSVQKVSFVND